MSSRSARKRAARRDGPPPVLPAFTGPIRSSEHRCTHCQLVFEGAWSEEEANAEELETFGHSSVGDDRATLCDPCWQSFLAYTREHGLGGPEC